MTVERMLELLILLQMKNNEMKYALGTFEYGNKTYDYNKIFIRRDALIKEFLMQYESPSKEE